VNAGPEARIVKSIWSDGLLFQFSSTMLNSMFRMLSCNLMSSPMFYLNGGV
jgi:hypothetical protein